MTDHGKADVHARHVDMFAIVTLGELLDDLEVQRIATDNRILALEREVGAAFPRLHLLAHGLKQLEKDSELDLKRIWRKHPLAPWAKSIPGLGEKSIARLIAIIGDPAERPNPAKLWQYCGHGDPNRRRAKGMTQAEALALGNPRAKKQVWLIASSLMQQDGKPDKNGRNRGARSPYRDVYEEARERYSDRVHERACVRCRPSGKPAQPGSPWNPAHQHAAAIRLVGKRFLLDLWKASRGE